MTTQLQSAIGQEIRCQTSRQAINSEKIFEGNKVCIPMIWIRAFYFTEKTAHIMQVNQSRTGTSVTKLWWMLITHRRGNNFSSCGSLLKIYTIAWERFLRALLTRVPHLNGDIFLKRISRGAQKYSSTWKGERVSAATGVERQQTTLATIPTTRARAHTSTQIFSPSLECWAGIMIP